MEKVHYADFIANFFFPLSWHKKCNFYIVVYELIRYPHPPLNNVHIPFSPFT
jgi:hypothetical protein